MIPKVLHTFSLSICLSHSLYFTWLYLLSWLPSVSNTKLHLHQILLLALVLDLNIGKDKSKTTFFFSSQNHVHVSNPMINMLNVFAFNLFVFSGPGYYWLFSLLFLFSYYCTNSKKVSPGKQKERGERNRETVYVQTPKYIQCGSS